MPNYENTKIYKIINNENDKIYIGHTTQTLSRRMGKHKSSNKYKCSSHHLGVDIKDCFIILVENHPCNNIDEAKRQERFYIEKYRKEGIEVVNKTLPGRTTKQYNQLPKRKENNKLYHRINRIELNKKKKKNIKKTLKNLKKEIDNNI